MKGNLLKRGNLVTYAKYYRAVAGDLFEQVGIFLEYLPWDTSSGQTEKKLASIYWVKRERVINIIVSVEGDKEPVFNVLA